MVDIWFIRARSVEDLRGRGQADMVFFDRVSWLFLHGLGTVSCMRLCPFYTLLAGIPFLMLLSSCSPSEPEHEAVRLPSLPAEVPDFTRAEFLALMKSVEERVRMGDGAFLDGLISSEDLLKKVEIGKVRKPELIDLFKEKVPPHLKVGSQVAEAIKGQGVFRLVRVYKAEREWHAIFRLVSESGILNYHDYEVRAARVDGGLSPRVVDVYVYSSGETLSRSLQRMYIAMYVGDTRERAKNFLSVDGIYGERLMQLQTVAMMVGQGHYPSALKIHLEQPAELQKEKFMLKQRLLMARHVGREEYLAALTEFKAYFPQDPAWVLVEMLRFQAEKDYSSFGAVIDVMKRTVGDDPYLVYLQGDSMYRLGKKKEGLAMLVASIQMDPLLKPAYWRLLDLHIERQEYSQATRLLETIRDHLGVEITNLEGDAKYKGFVSSPDYVAWKAQKK